MNWKKITSKFNGRMTREKWLFLLVLGVLLMILAVPVPDKGKIQEAGKDQEQKAAPLWQGETEADADSQTAGTGIASGASGEDSYAKVLEGRIRELLKSVEGVGQVDVMVVLSSSGERVMRVDRSVSTSSNSERDSAGGARESDQTQSQESTVLVGDGSGGTQPVVEKELSPELSGIVISAQGGGSPAVQAEISEAMEALFGLPAHKIKVLKRVE